MKENPFIIYRLSCSVQEGKRAKIYDGFAFFEKKAQYKKCTEPLGFIYMKSFISRCTSACRRYKLP